MILRLCIMIFLLGDGLLLAQDELFELAKQTAEAYSLEASFGLEEYRMIAEISAETSPLSELLNVAKASMEILQTRTVRVDGFECYPKIFADDRHNKAKDRGGSLDPGPFARVEMWERLAVDGRVLDLRDEKGKPKTADFSKPVSATRLSLDTACMKPFDWPIHGPSSFDAKHKEKDFHIHTFGADRKCIFAIRKGDLLDLNQANLY